MRLTRTYRYAAVFVTALLLLLQGASLSHAASHGQNTHEHDGVICVLSVQNEVDAVIPAPDVTYTPAALIDTPRLEFETDYISLPSRHYRGREPPPRAPPSQ